LQKKSLRQWLREPSSWIVVLVVGGFFSVVWGFCFLTALMLSSSAGGQGLFGAETILGLAALASVIFAGLMGVWGLISLGLRVMSGGGGLIDGVFSGLLRRSEAAPELDESPAMLARKRGDGEGAARMYRQWTQEFPHRTELFFFIAQIEHQDLGDRDAGLRGYRDFLRRLDALDREPTAREREYVPLAQAYIADLEREPEPPKRRVIKV